MFKIFGSILISLGAFGAFTSVASASAVTVNRGALMSQLVDDNQGAQAPGQTGIGPLTIVNGTVILPPAFAGGAGGTHTSGH